MAIKINQEKLIAEKAVRELNKRILIELLGISYEDLTTAEKNILKIVGQEKYLTNLRKFERSING